MSGSRWTDVEDEYLRMASRNLTAAEIAVRLERTPRSIHHRAQILGLRMKTPAEIGAYNSERWLANLEAKLGEPVCAWLRRRYIGEKATYRELTKETGINTRSLMKLMKRCEIDPIDARTAVRREMAEDPNFLAPMLAAARTPEATRKRALWRQVNWQTFCSPQELEFLHALNDASLFPIPQLAVGTYNIDFAFPDAMLAVETDPLWHKSKRKRPRDGKRDAFLTAEGWTVLRLESRNSMAFKVRKVSEAITSRASTHPR